MKILIVGIEIVMQVGGLLGGAAVAWLIGPAFSFDFAPGSGKKQLFDRPPIARLISPWSKQPRGQ